MAHVADHRLVPDCRISVGGTPLRLDDDAALARVDVDLDVDLFGHCALTFHDPRLRLADGPLFASGVAIEVEIGFHTKLRRVFEGEVVALEPQFRRDVPPSLKVVCLETLHRLGLTQKTRAFNAVDDRQIVGSVAREHGLRGTAPAGTPEHVLQSNVTDAVFLRRLAQKHGNHLRISGRQLIVGPPPAAGHLTVAPGDGLRRIKVRVSATSQVSEVSVHGWDPARKRDIAASARGTGVVGEGARQHGGGARLSLAGLDQSPPDVATAEQMAKGRMRKIAEGFVKAEVEMTGNPEIVPGKLVQFASLGAELEGTFRVEHARHQFSRHGYLVSFRAVRTAKKAPAAARPQGPAQPQATFLDIELLDSDGKPMAQERYEVTTPDGKVIRGTLDSAGKARLSGLSRGACSVTFPALDGKAGK